MPSAGDSGPQTTSSTSESLRPLPLPEAVRFGLENKSRGLMAAARRPSIGPAATRRSPSAPVPAARSISSTATSLPTSPSCPARAGDRRASSTSPTSSPYSVYQSELQLQWTLYDFGRTAGRATVRPACLREKIAELQAHAPKETVAYDVATAYLEALEAAAAAGGSPWKPIRRAEAVLPGCPRAPRRQGGPARRRAARRGAAVRIAGRPGPRPRDPAEITAAGPPPQQRTMGRDGQFAAAARRRAVYPGRSSPPHWPTAFSWRPRSGRRSSAIARDRVAVAPVPADWPPGANSCPASP